MNKVIASLVFILAASIMSAQENIGINTGLDGPDPSAVLDLTSTDKGLKLPYADTASIVNPALGLLTHNIWDGKVYQFSINGWEPLVVEKDLHWVQMYDWISNRDDRDVAIGSSGPIFNYKLSVQSTDSDQAGSIYASSTHSTAIFGTVNNSNAPAGIFGSHTSAGSSGNGGKFTTFATSGAGVFGHAHNSSADDSRGGLFISEGVLGMGVQGIVNNTSSGQKYGGHFTNESTEGAGVFGSVENSDAGLLSYGGQFNNGGTRGKGLYVTTLNTSGVDNHAAVFLTRGTSSRGVSSTATGSVGRGIYGEATDDEALTVNYGGYFSASGGQGRGVLGIAENYSENTNMGGFFQANGQSGMGVYGVGNNPDGDVNYGGFFYASGQSGIGAAGHTIGTTGTGVVGEATNVTATVSYGGKFTSNGTAGRGVFGYASNDAATVSYGGYFQSDGSEGRGVYGSAPDATASVNYGGYFEAAGISGKGVLGRSVGAAGTGVVGVAMGSSGKAVVGEALGVSSKAVYGLCQSSTGENYSGYFTTVSPDGTGIYARGKKAGAVLDGDLVVNSYDNTTARISLYEADHYGFQLEYDGANDKLSLWSRKFSGNEAKRMTWQKNGNVGIGTDSPEHVLDIEKNANQELRMKSTAGSSDILLDGTTGSNAIEFLENGTFKSSLGWSVTNDRFFIYQQGNALTVKNGNVGIKDTDPTYTLELPNDVTTGVGRVKSWTYYSDKRIKKDVKVIPYGLETICRLEPKSYNQHNSSFENGKLKLTDEYEYTLGLLAQDVHMIIPEIVDQPIDENEDLWSMNYLKIVPILIQAVKEQNDVINEQKTLIEDLSSKLSFYKTNTEEQEARLQKVEAALFGKNQ